MGAITVADFRSNQLEDLVSALVRGYKQNPSGATGKTILQEQRGYVRAASIACAAWVTEARRQRYAVLANVNEGLDSQFTGVHPWEYESELTRIFDEHRANQLTAYESAAYLVRFFDNQVAINSYEELLAQYRRVQIIDGKIPWAGLTEDEQDWVRDQESSARERAEMLHSLSGRDD